MLHRHHLTIYDVSFFITQLGQVNSNNAIVEALRHFCPAGLRSRTLGCILDPTYSGQTMSNWIKVSFIFHFCWRGVASVYAQVVGRFLSVPAGSWHQSISQGTAGCEKMSNAVQEKFWNFGLGHAKTPLSWALWQLALRPSPKFGKGIEEEFRRCSTWLVCMPTKAPE